MNFFASLETGTKLDLLKIFEIYDPSEEINLEDYLIPMDSVENCGNEFDQPIERQPMETISIITTRLVL